MMTLANDGQVSAEQFLSMPAGEMRSYLQGDKVPPQLTEQQMAQLPPGTEFSYAQARAKGGDDSWLQYFQSMATSAAAAEEAQQDRRSQLATYDVEYRDGVPGSDSNYSAHRHEDLKKFVEPITAENITIYSDTYHDLYNTFQRMSDVLRESVGKSQHDWEGGAADSAHGYFTSLSEWANGNSENARMASDVISSEAEAATRAKNSMPEPIPFSMDQEMKNWGSNPFSIHEEITKTIEKQAQSRQAHDEAVQVMAQYDADLQDAGNKQPVFAEPPKFSSSGGAGGPDMPSANVISLPGGDAGTSASGFAGGVGGSPTGPAGGGAISTSPGGGAGSSSSPPPLAGGPSTGAGAAPPVGTAPSGFQPGQRPPATRPGNRPGSGPNQFGPGGGPMPVGGMPPGGGQLGPGGAPGTAGRMSGGFGPGGGAGGAAGPGAGAGTGAKAMGGPAAAAGPGAAAPGAGSGARGGMGGAPMGGAGGKGGQGGEDSDHQRPTFLVEADPDEVFGTSERTAPPVIGA